MGSPDSHSPDFRSSDYRSLDYTRVDCGDDDVDQTHHRDGGLDQRNIFKLT